MRSILSWLFGAKHQGQVRSTADDSHRLVVRQIMPATKPLRVHKKGSIRWHSNSFPMEAVGESHYQPALENLCCGLRRESQQIQVSARIELEPHNQFDPNAIKISVKGELVGYLSREQALRVGQQMKDEGILEASCLAQIRGGWRTNQYDQGMFGIQLAIPQQGRIDFGFGTQPTKSKAPVPRAKKSRPEPAGTGPLLGQRVALIGTPKNGDIAIELATHGAQIMTGVGKTTTLFVVNENRPFTSGLIGSRGYRLAQDCINNGTGLRIVSLDELRSELEEC